MKLSNEPGEATAVMNVIAAESTAYWDKDFAAWAACWAQTATIRRMGWWAHGGINLVEGWDALSARVKESMNANPTPNPTAAQVRRENVNLRVTEDMAWVTFDQYGPDTGEQAMDMPGISRETRILEKHDGSWKIVYVCWLLEE